MTASDQDVVSQNAEIIIENEYITVAYLPDKRTVYHTINKPVGGQAFRDALNAGTEALKKHKACKWLSDDRKNGPLSDEDLEWGKDWNHRTIEAGWKYWALVVPEAVAAAGSLTQEIMRLAELNLRMMVFTNLNEASKWLEQMKE